MSKPETREAAVAAERHEPNIVLPKPQYERALHNGRWAASNGCQFSDNPYVRRDYRTWWELGRRQRLERIRREGR